MNDRECTEQHRFDEKFATLPIDQGGAGRHRCAGCAYDLGFWHGYQRLENLRLDFDSLPYSQAGTVRHRSPHAAYALGYYEGVVMYYGELAARASTTQAISTATET